MKSFFLFLAIILLSTTVVSSQTDQYVGTFKDPGGYMTLSIKKVEDGYHGAIQSNHGFFALKGTASGNMFSGTIYTPSEVVPFSAMYYNQVLTLTAFGHALNLDKTSTTHNLDHYDLTTYMYGENGRTPLPPDADYDHNYNQYNRGSATETYHVYNNAPVNTPSPYPSLNDPQLQQIVAGSQLVYYTRTSILNSSTASSITYMNFCSNGTFSMNYDGSFAVEGYYGDNAQGASNGRHSGTWQLVTYNGQPAVFLAYRNGETSVNPFLKANVLAGRWRIGNTQYALARNKAVCR